ncbi:hypothetical protein BD324DRAFT_652640 [Kockovaella imperatae]|uniref:Uncharacterized protein n=1 Tax=Kockovaella imperatae TaxID=4999 RepID=A0A1Y1UA68_9TREE|nr:hypothetical protein BD324DRAFT_652640 [Kockovaella imperatae]ORX34918.1 hypothetical protein BD324DRAFT_652640 [Kockovaella imperatae]
MPSSSAPGVSSSERKAIEAAQEKKKKAAKAKAEKLEAYKKKAAPDTVEELVEVGELESKWFKEGEWKPEWALVEFNDDACLANVTKAGKAKDGFFVPAGSILPLGASLPDMTVLKYGGYFPAGTSFQGGVMIPLHARMVNILPEETKEVPTMVDEGLCVVQ